MSKPVRKAWNGGSREAAMAEATRHREAVRLHLSALYKDAAPTMHMFAIDAPYRHALEPGWVYLPIDDVVILEETVRRIIDDAGKDKAA